MEEELKYEKTVIVAFGDIDYAKLRTVAEQAGESVSTFIEKATIEKINRKKSDV